MDKIPPRSGTAFHLKKGQRLKVIDPQGEQVSDLFCFMKSNHEEYLSSGRTFDYLSKIFVTKGDKLYSSNSRPMLSIEEDTVGRHDFLLTPCSKDTFKIIYKDEHPHPGCQGNLLKGFENFGIHRESLPATLNIFMYVSVDERGKLEVLPPKSKAGDFIIFKALEDLVVGLTACSALDSNNGSFKPIHFELIE